MQLLALLALLAPAGVEAQAVVALPGYETLAPTTFRLLPANAHWMLSGFGDPTLVDPTFTVRVNDVAVDVAVKRFAGAGVGSVVLDVDLAAAGPLPPGANVSATCESCFSPLAGTVGEGVDVTPPTFREGLRNGVVANFIDGIGWQVKACVPALDDADDGDGGLPAAIRIESDSTTALVPLFRGACGPDEVDVSVIAEGVDERLFCMLVFGVDLAGNEVALDQDICIELEAPPRAQSGCGCAQSPDAPFVMALAFVSLLVVRRRKS